MSSYEDIIVKKSRECGGGGVLRLSYLPAPAHTGRDWKATTVLAREKKRLPIAAWGEDPDDAIYNLCLMVVVIPCTRVQPPRREGHELP